MSIVGLIFWAGLIFGMYQWTKNRLPGTEVGWAVSTAIFPLITTVVFCGFIYWKQGYIISRDII